MSDVSSSSDPRDKKPSPDVLSAHLEGEAVLLDMETKRYFRLNDTASAIWRGLEQGLDRTRLRASLKEQYEVDEAELDAALDRAIASFAERGLIRPEPAS